jgi:hydrogenase-4 component B
MRERPDLAPLFWLALFGFGLKAGLFPLHIWLPAAHANAPSHVSAIMSGVTIKLGIYGLVRFSGWLPVPGAAGWVVVGLGVVSAVLGVACALAQNDIKRLLAYCSVENIGIILVGLGFALVGAAQGDAAWGRLALAAALLHVWNHGLFKALLFLGAGSVVHGTGTREMSRLGGLWRRMPWTAGLFAFGAVAICGLPPLNGFVSEWLVYLGLFDAVAGRGAVAWAAIPAVIGLAVTGALAVACFVKVSAITFLGAPRTQAAARAHESGALMVGPMIFLAAGCLAIALVPVWPWQVMTRAAAAWNPAWAAAGGSPVPLATLGALNAGLALLLALAVGWLWARTRRNGLRRALTWDCGYAAPTAHMQYTGGSFAALAVGWFAWLILPDRRLRRPHGVFPAEAHRIEQLPDAVLFRVVRPVGRGILAVSTAVRRLQQGRLQFYILYLVTGLAALGVLVLAGGAP